MDKEALFLSGNGIPGQEGNKILSELACMDASKDKTKNIWEVRVTGKGDGQTTDW